ncbi:MAG TPA: RNA polymerase sigma factor [Candidatus Paceibacterota bacterium]|nr:RNA polymerase sigma factor [Candidatus Paceibacterota bacterium]
MIQGIMSISSEVPNMGALSDEEVLQQAQYDSKVFAVLVDRYEKPFLRKARSIVRNREDAEEVVQDAFTRIYLYADRYRSQEGASFSSWAYTILTRVALTRYGKLKRRHNETVNLDPEHYEALPDTEHFIERLTIRDEVLVALSRLPETAARVLRLQFLEGKTQEQVARAEGTTVSAIKTRVHRAKKLFKQSIDHDRTH